MIIGFTSRNPCELPPYPPNFHFITSCPFFPFFPSPIVLNSFHSLRPVLIPSLPSSLPSLPHSLFPFLISHSSFPTRHQVTLRTIGVKNVDVALELPGVALPGELFTGDVASVRREGGGRYMWIHVGMWMDGWMDVYYYSSTFVHRKRAGAIVRTCAPLIARSFLQDRLKVGERLKIDLLFRIV